ncbi:NitT/TauT family transport system ATP-binding protein [Natronocella acetinitrilica]|uniref:NitT/TauT family transport system ATP-binding protein n=1 Tax=Natronocella acetinitrilica TaxID=414046 RepID=A0AAE3G6H7_9GAMM|nr:NitT/TauT family transport system ATP-binding protein [Natronocella acetinitrilica]
MSFSYGGDTDMVLGDVSFDLSEGDFVAVLGGSGSGKSTLLRLIGGLLSPTEGEIRINDQVVRGPTRDAGFVFQAARLMPWKTVLENVLIPTRAHGKSTPEQRQRALELLGSVGLEKAADLYPNQLSGGMAQRVGLARMLMHDPKLLLMDEPFAALDALTREVLSDELQALWLRERKTVMFVTHSIPEAVFLADRVMVLGGQPAGVVETIDVPLPRPRTVRDMASEEFNAIAHQLRELLASRFSAMPGIT